MEYKEWNGFKVYEDGTVIGRSGKEVGCSTSKYKRIVVKENGGVKAYNVHVLVYKLFIGEIPEGLLIDHVDTNKYNNHWSNLKAVTPRENTSKLIEKKNKSSKYIGVCWKPTRNKWQAQIFFNKKIHLGYFDNEEDAHKAYLYFKEQNNII